MPSSSSSTTSQLILEDERVVLHAYSALVSGEYRTHTAGVFNTGGSPGGAVAKKTLRVSEGPPPPPGWMIDLNDRVLLTYDPYFGTARKQDCALKQLDAKERHYARDELPMCRAETFSMQTLPPAGDVVHCTAKGRYVVANRSIKAGEMVAMDTSLHTVVNDPRVFLYPPPHAAGGKVTSGDRMMEVTRKMVRSASMLRGSSPGDGSQLMQRVMLVSSLLLTHGDLHTLPRRARRGTASCACGNTNLESLFPKSALHKSSQAQRITDALLALWWRNDESNSNKTSNAAMTSVDDFVDVCPQAQSSTTTTETAGDQSPLMGIARLVLQCIPVELFAESSSAPTPCCGSDWRTFGFLSRLGLHRPRTLAAWFSVWDANGFGLQSPDLLSRIGLFPFLRFFEHECRPTCHVVPLDCPITHTSGIPGSFHYDTKAKDAKDPYESAGGERAALTPAEVQSMWWGTETTQRIFYPSVIAIVATRDIAVGEPLSISYIPAAYMTQPQRINELWQRYKFICTCKWCTTEPDLARGFRCPRCEYNQGVICPVGDGSKLDLWMCLQCGYHPDVETEIPKLLDAELEVNRIKSDKAKGLVTLLSNDKVHYSHAAVFRKLDTWSETFWREQQASDCVSCLEALQRCARRVMDPCDPSMAQFHEFMGQVEHAVGNAHTARYEYFLAFQIRLRSGARLAHWTRKTQFMAAEKSLADFLDSR